MKTYMLRKFLLTGIISFCVTVAATGQVDYLRYYNSLISEIKKDLQLSSEAAMQSTNKEIYVLYFNGNQIAFFLDESSYKEKINSIKLRINNWVESILNNKTLQAQD